MNGTARPWNDGKNNTDMELVNLQNLEAVLREYGEEVARNYKDLILDRGHNASGDLVKSVRTYVVQGDRAFEVKMDLASYWKYLEEGTRPHWPPRSAILRWIEVKPVIPRPDRNGRIPTPQQLAFLISRKIAGEGTPATHLLEDTKDAVLPLFRQRIAEALGRDFENYIRKVVIGEA